LKNNSSCSITLSLCLLTLGLIGADRLIAQNLDSVNTIRSKKETYSPLRLESADELENQRVDGKDVMRATGKVKFSQDTLTATCDRAAFFKELQVAILFDHVVLNDRHRTIYSNRAKYFAKQKKAICEGNVLFLDSAMTLVADSLVYFQNLDQMLAEGSVVMYDSIESVALYGEKGFYDVKRKYATVKGHPYMIQFDSTKFKGQNIARLSRGLPSKPLLDSAGKPQRYEPDEQLTARGVFVESFIDSHRVMVHDSVEFMREKLITHAGLAAYQTQRETLRLTKTPVANYDRSDVIGDTMVVQFRKREIENIFIKGNAIATSVADSASKRKNRLTAKSITMNIQNKKLKTMNAEGNAYNLYYLENNDGANEISGPTIIMFFDKNSKLKNFRVQGGAEGTYYPEKLMDKIPVKN